MEVLKNCPLCGRDAYMTTKTDTIGIVFINTTIIRCCGKTEETKDSKGCNLKCSAADQTTAIAMWNRRDNSNEKETDLCS